MTMRKAACSLDRLPLMPRRGCCRCPQPASRCRGEQAAPGHPTPAGYTPAYLTRFDRLVLQERDIAEIGRPRSGTDVAGTCGVL
jgi:hypothetical protein